MARSLAGIASQDAVGAKQMYARKRYSLATYLLQQSVEKSTKATGLLAVLLHPTKQDLLEVGHRSVLGILLGMPKKIEEARTALIRLKESSAYAEYGRLGLEKLLPDPNKVVIPESMTIQGWIEGIRRLPPADMWQRTLELRPNDPLTLAIMRELTQADESAKAVDLVDEITFKLLRAGLVLDIGFLLYSSSLYGRCLRCAIVLSLVTMWHETPTRYPPVESSDYWSWDAYTADKGLIGQFSMMQEHSSQLAAGARWAAEAASIAEFP